MENWREVKQKGFQLFKGITIVEIMIIVAILSILAAVMIPSTVRYLKKRKLREGGLSEPQINQILEKNGATSDATSLDSKNYNLGFARSLHTVTVKNCHLAIVVAPGAVAITKLYCEKREGKQ